jgi:thiamine-phosphate pyrophosphorylase
VSIRPYPDRFYPIAGSLSWLIRLVEAGAGTVQLRVKDLEHAQATALVREALDVTRGTDTRLVVNDYWQAAIDAGASHLHLGQEDLLTADLKAIRRAGLSLGLSTHDEEELDRALSCEPDYVALGPIYPTTVKTMRFGPQGLEKLGLWKARIGRLPLVAIGGITLERAPDVYAAGADSIAVVTDIIASPDPDTRIAAWRDYAASPTG